MREWAGKRCDFPTSQIFAFRLGQSSHAEFSPEETEGQDPMPEYCRLWIVRATVPFRVEVPSGMFHDQSTQPTPFQIMKGADEYFMSARFVQFSGGPLFEEMVWGGPCRILNDGGHGTLDYYLSTSM